MLSQRLMGAYYGVSQPAFLAWLRIAGLNGGRLDTPEIALLAACVGELTRAGLPGAKAARLVGEIRDELVYAARIGGAAWMVLVNPWSDAPNTVVVPEVDRLGDIASSHPLTIVVSLPALIADARATLTRLEAASV